METIWGGQWLHLLGILSSKIVSCYQNLLCSLPYQLGSKYCLTHSKKRVNSLRYKHEACIHLLLSGLFSNQRIYSISCSLASLTRLWYIPSTQILILIKGFTASLFSNHSGLTRSAASTTRSSIDLKCGAYFIDNLDLDLQFLVWRFWYTPSTQILIRIDLNIRV